MDMASVRAERLSAEICSASETTALRRFGLGPESVIARAGSLSVSRFSSPRAHIPRRCSF